MTRTLLRMIKSHCSELPGNLSRPRVSLNRSAALKEQLPNPIARFPKSTRRDSSALLGDKVKAKLSAEGRKPLRTPAPLDSRRLGSGEAFQGRQPLSPSSRQLGVLGGGTPTTQRGLLNIVHLLLPPAENPGLSGA